MAMNNPAPFGGMEALSNPAASASYEKADKLNAVEMEKHCLRAVEYLMSREQPAREIETKIIYRVQKAEEFARLEQKTVNGRECIVVPPYSFDAAFIGRDSCPAKGAGLCASWWSCLMYYQKTSRQYTPATQSVYGDTRLDVPIGQAIDIRRHRLYFVHFGCYTKTHYVQLLVAEKNSEQDRRAWAIDLPELDWHENAFLWYNKEHHKFYHNNHRECNIEILISYEMTAPRELTRITKMPKLNENCCECRPWRVGDDAVADERTAPCLMVPDEDDMETEEEPV